MIIPYLIKSTLCLAVLFGFYKIALESKALHQFKRYYLLASLVFSLTIPLVTFTYTTAAVPQDIWIENFVVVQDQNTGPITPVIIEEKTNYLPYVLWSIYGIGILIFGGRFAGNLVRLKRKITTAETHQQKDFTLALLQQTIVPHSFLKYIFLSRKRYENKEIPPEVIAHEATHVRQKHSLDILFIEFLQVIFWFNPLFWITKKSITLNHEFLADQGAVQEQHDIYQYQNILLSYASSTHHTTLESPFNYSSTKKRILMLSQSFNRKRLAISALLLIPIIAGCVLIFNQGIIAQPNNDLAIEGHWIDKKHENTNVSIYKENDVLWWDMNNNKTPITTKNGEYYIDLAPHNRAIDKKIKLSIENELLKVGDSIYYITLENTISHRIHGIWMTPDGDTKYHFNGINGGTTCDVINVSENKSARYYPDPIDNGMTFTMGHDWVTFTFEGEQLITQDGVKLNRVKEKVYARSIDINILDDTHFEVDGVKTTRKNLQQTLASLHKDLSKEQRDRVINIHVSSQKDISYQDLVFLQKIATSYGYHRIVTPKEEIIRSKGNTPMANHTASKAEDGVEMITLEIVEDGKYLVNGKVATDENLSNVLHTFNKDISKEERKNLVNVIITSPEIVHMNQIKKIRNQLINYGVKQLQMPGGIVIPNAKSNNYLKVNHPTKQDLARWLDTDQYGVWLDGVQIKNDVLKEYHPDDLPYYIESKLEKNAANYGKHFVQVNIMTNPYWQEKKGVGFPSTFNVNLNNTESVILKPAYQNQQSSGKEAIEKEAFEAMHQQTTNNYATEFVEGAERNGKKAFVIVP